MREKSGQGSDVININLELIVADMAVRPPLASEAAQRSKATGLISSPNFSFIIYFKLNLSAITHDLSNSRRKQGNIGATSLALHFVRVAVLSSNGS
jgi:hypothetical protein